MKTMLVENTENMQRVYESLLLDARHLGIFSSELAVKIINELAKSPACAMDVAKRLRENEQKIYYHLRKMRGAGIVKLNGTEQRYGMTAKMFQLVSPVIATKLYEDGYTTRNTVLEDPKIEKFLEPFIKDGTLNAIMVVGSPRPHGKYEATARDGIHTIDLALFLGRFIKGLGLHNYKIDVEVDRHKDLKNNIILIGSPKINTITDKINSALPIYFDEKKNWSIISKISGKTYDYEGDAVIIKMKNPLNKKKDLLLLAGRHSYGLRSSILAFTRNIEEITKGNVNNENVIAKIIRGIDKDGDNIIDTIHFLE